jgi:uncharacterized protein
MPTPTEEEIDDLLYFSRVNEVPEFKELLEESSKRHGCSTTEVIKAVVDEISGNTILHYSSANGHIGNFTWSCLNLFS